jgi:hypothetical protein
MQSPAIRTAGKVMEIDLAEAKEANKREREGTPFFFLRAP